MRRTSLLVVIVALFTVGIGLAAELESVQAPAPVVNPEVHEAYLKGRYQLEKLTDDGTKLAISYFEQALERDPNYALAYAGLAQAYLRARFAGVLPRNEAIKRAKAAGEKALELDPTLWEGHASLAIIRYEHDWDWAGAERAFKRAIELNPHNANTHYWYSHYLQSMGRSEESLAASKRAVELDPLSPVMNLHLGWEYYVARQYDQAIEQLRKALELDPNHPLAHNHLGRIFLQKGMYEKAIAKHQEAVNLAGVNLKHDLGYAYAVAGKTEEAVKILDELKELRKRRDFQPTGLAQLYGVLGEKEQAFAWLEKAYEERDGWLRQLKVDPRFDPLRDDPRFEGLLRRMNFPE